jgi:spore coat protein A
MRFDVVKAKGPDESRVPSVLRPAAAQVDETHLPTTEGEAVTTRRWDFGRIKNDNGSFGNFTINGLQWDENRVDALPVPGDTEIWEFTNSMEQRGFVHPVHVHLLNFKVLGRKNKDSPYLDPPLPYETSWKETVAVRQDETVRVLMKWPEVPDDTPAPTEFNRKYAFHCHNIRHEDIRMMVQFEVQ